MINQCDEPEMKILKKRRSDSLNISERARRVACLLGHTRRHWHGRHRAAEKINNNTFDVSDGDVPAAGPLGRSGKNKGTCSFFFVEGQCCLL